MSGVHTVRGEIDPAHLGACLPHEHVICDFTLISGGAAEHLLNDVTLAVEELTRFRAAGGGAVVDVTTPDIGRDPAKLLRISRAADVHLVMGTGWYRKLFHPSTVDTTPTDALAEAMVVELTEGVDGVPAGIIGEIGVDKDLVSAAEERVLRASARAHLATGAPITLHASMHPVGLAQLDLLREEGVDPASVVVGHADTILDLDYHREVLRRGARLQYDTAGRLHMNPDDRRARFLVHLVREGWLERLLVSSDRCYRSDLVAFGGVGYAHVLTGFRALLCEEGLSDEEFATLTVANPARMLTW